MKFKTIKVKQNDYEFYLFSANAKFLWNCLDINKRTEDKVDGYQRALSESRALEIKKYIENKNIIAPAIIISLEKDKVKLNKKTSELSISGNQKHAGWIIDGQHRLRGAQLVKNDVELPVIAFIGLELEDQIKQFVTINKEGKGVPTSLYYDLLKLLPEKKNAGEVAKEKAAAIADALRKDSDSLFYERIVVVTAPKRGQISLTNFVRKVAPMIQENRGNLAAYSQKEVTGIIDNYFKALKVTFPNEFSVNRQRFFQTLGFGAVMNALFPIFSITLKQRNGFTVDDITIMLRKIKHFNFSDWDNVGSGSAAEIQTGKDLEAVFRAAVSEEDNADSSSMLKL